MTRKVPPNPNLRRFSHRRERRLQAADDKSAAGYEALEHGAKELADLAEKAKRGDLEPDE